jgi:putative ABC transport system substrate-binding protein
MRRREFITLIGGAVLWPFAVNAQQALPVVGFLSSRSPEESAHLVEAFRGGLKDGGFIEGRSVSLEFRWAHGDYDRLPALAAELVNRRVSVIAAVGGDPSNKAAKQATATIPIVFATGSDPVQLGLVESFNRPGGNATGVTTSTNLMEPKRLGLLRELAPGVSVVGVLVNPNFPAAVRQAADIEQAARAVGQHIFARHSWTKSGATRELAETIRTRSPVLRPRFFRRSIAPLRSRRRMAAIRSRQAESLPDTGERRAIATRCGLKRQEIEHIFDQLEALGWLIRTPGPLWSKPPHWQVNPEVHRRFAERATQEAIERERNREMLQRCSAHK